MNISEPEVSARSLRPYEVTDRITFITLKDLRNSRILKAL